jgi:Arc/MetJ-type ribon-helix-helix transcriptional regulator
MHMTTLSVPITLSLAAGLDALINSGAAESRAAVMRTALQRYLEEQALLGVLEGQSDVKAGRVYKGNLRTLIAQLP